MKNYRIIVNGVSYDVAVQELEEAGDAVIVPPPAAAQAAAAPVRNAGPAAAAAAGSIKINSPMPGKIVAIKAASGDTVSKGDVVLVLEAMKMENEICAPQDGTIAGIQVAVGDQVEGGDLLATMD